MSKILIIANSDVGLFKFRKELIEKLLTKHSVCISLPYGDYINEFTKMGCDFINTEINSRGTNPITDLQLILKYNSIIKKVKPDVVLSYTIKPNIYGGIICRINNIPYIPNITGLGSAVENKSILQKITISLYKIAMKNASCVFFQNEENMNFMLKNGIIKSNYKIIPGSGVNLDYYNVLDYPNDNKLKFVYISRVMKEKGIDQYIEAAKYITKNNENVEFHILGNSNDTYKKKLIALEEEGIIKYHGMQKDVKEFLKNSHCTIHPTYYPEGMSNVLLESAACARPIITTDRSGCKEIVDDCITGFIIKQRDTLDLISKIDKFISLSYEEKKNMGLAGRSKVEQEFSRNIVINEYLNEIRKVI